jgi:pyruvate kinase
VDFILDHNISWIALSFVRNPGDIRSLKEIINNKRKSARVIAKIEKPEAIDSIDEIIEISDGIMVARGDLGVETPFNKVPILQKQIIHKCITKATPVIIATQMMESMITNFLPTRAEATDVSNAVLDGADAVMLSGETSVGKYPVEAIANMEKVVNSTELSGFYLDHEHRPDKNSPTYLPDSVCYNTYKMASQTEANGIVIFTTSGGSAFKIASHRPNTRIFAFTMDTQVMHELSLIRGVQAFLIAEEVNINDAIDHAIKVLKRYALIKAKDILIFAGGIPMNKREPVNMIKIVTV